MSVRSAGGEPPGGPAVRVPTMSVAEAGGGDLLLGYGAKQLAVGALVGGAALMVVVGAVAAGAYVLLSPGGSDPDLDLVPAGSDTVTYVNVDQARSDRAIRKVLDTALEVSPGGADSTDEALAEFENETGLDPADLHHATGFSRYEDATGEGASDYSATIVRTDWTESAVVEATEDENVTLSERAFMGHTVYEPTGGVDVADSWLAVLDDGTYVLGTENATKDVVAVSEGEMDPVEGEVRSSFESTRAGYLMFATRVPEQRLPSDLDDVDAGKYGDVKLLTGAYYAKRNALGVEMTMHASNEEAADDIQDETLGALKLFRAGLQNEKLQSALRDVTIEQQGTDVVVTYEDSADSIQEVVRAVEEERSEEGDSARLDGRLDVADEPTGSIGDIDVADAPTGSVGADHRGHVGEP
jgi:hypothetical protein